MTAQAYILVEGVEEIAQAESLRTKKFPQGVVYVSLSSQAKYELVRKGLGHVNAYDYCDLEELYRVTDRQYEDLRRQCVALDQFLESKIPELMKYGIKPFFFNYYQTKIILDTIKQRTFMVQGVYQAFGDRLYAFESCTCDWLRYLKPSDRFTGNVLKSISGEAHILPRDMEGNNHFSSETPADICIMQELERRRHHYKRLYIRLVRKLKQGLANFVARRIIWTLSPFISMESLSSAGLKRVTPHLEKNALPAVDVPEVIFIQDAFSEMVSYAGIGSRPMLEAWFRANVLNAIPGYIAKAQEIEGLMVHDRPVLLESRTYFSPEEQLMATQFVRQGKKVVGTNHGSLGIQNEKIFGIGDFQYVSDYFVWGSGVAEYIAHQYPLPLSRNFTVHVSGTGHFETDVELSRSDLCRLLNIPENRIIVLMPGSGFGHNIFYNWYLLMSEQQEYENQAKIVDFFADCNDCIFIYKGLSSSHYDESHIQGYIHDKGADNLLYMNKTPLRHILPAIDVFMTDRPSTSILEAMGHGKICYSYNRWMTFPGDSAVLYNEAAQHFLTQEEMLEKFSKDARNKFSDVSKNLRYYKTYGNATTAEQRQRIFTEFLSRCLHQETELTL